MSDNQFGRRLKELREAAGLTQPVLAAAAGWSKSYLADVEQGRYAPSWDKVMAMTKALGVSCEAFQVEAADIPAPGRGRPAKAEEPEPPAKAKPKRKPKSS